MEGRSRYVWQGSTSRKFAYACTVDLTSVGRERTASCRCPRQWRDLSTHHQRNVVSTRRENPRKAIDIIRDGITSSLEYVSQSTLKTSKSTVKERNLKDCWEQR